MGKQGRTKQSHLGEVVPFLLGCVCLGASTSNARNQASSDRLASKDCELPKKIEHLGVAYEAAEIFGDQLLHENPFVLQPNV
jgi:hypothetical protein